MDDEGSETIFLYVVTDIIVDQHDKSLYDPPEGYTSIADSVGSVVSQQKRYKLAFFSEGRDTLALLKKTEA